MVATTASLLILLRVLLSLFFLPRELLVATPAFMTSSTPSLQPSPTLAQSRVRKFLSSTSPLVAPTTHLSFSVNSTSSPSPLVPRRPSLPRSHAETSATGVTSLTTGTSANTPRPSTLVPPAGSCPSRLLCLLTVPPHLALAMAARAAAVLGAMALTPSLLFHHLTALLLLPQSL